MCAFVCTPGRSIWIQQPIVGSTWPPVVGFVYWNATSSNGLASTFASSRSARSVCVHGKDSSGETGAAARSQIGRRWPLP